MRFDDYFWTIRYNDGSHVLLDNNSDEENIKSYIGRFLFDRYSRSQLYLDFDIGGEDYFFIAWENLNSANRMHIVASEGDVPSKYQNIVDDSDEKLKERLYDICVDMMRRLRQTLYEL